MNCFYISLGALLATILVSSLYEFNMHRLRVINRALERERDDLLFEKQRGDFQ